MILRVWRARAVAERAELYPRHLTETVLPQLRTMPGFIGANLLKREHGREVEFVVETMWESMQAIERFAGLHPSMAVVEPAARAALISFDTVVSHYEIIYTTLPIESDDTGT